MLPATDEHASVALRRLHPRSLPGLPCLLDARRGEYGLRVQVGLCMNPSSYRDTASISLRLNIWAVNNVTSDEVFSYSPQRTSDGKHEPKHAASLLFSSKNISVVQLTAGNHKLCSPCYFDENKSLLNFTTWTPGLKTL